MLREFDQLIGEMEFDGEREEATKAKAGRAKLADRLSAEEKAELRDRQGRVRERYRQRDRIRRARVNRAFVSAKLFGSRAVRKTAFYLVAAGLLATGSGLQDRQPDLRADQDAGQQEVQRGAIRIAVAFARTGRHEGTRPAILGEQRPRRCFGVLAEWPDPRRRRRHGRPT